MGAVPVQLRFTLSPAELLAKLDITADSRISSLKRGIVILVEELSGNFAIDEPFLHQMFQVVANRRRPEAQEMVEVLRETPFPLESFIRRQPRAAVALLDSDLETAVRPGAGKRSGGVSAGAHYLPANKRGPGAWPPG